MVCSEVTFISVVYKIVREIFLFIGMTSTNIKIKDKLQKNSLVANIFQRSNQTLRIWKTNLPRTLEKQILLPLVTICPRR